MAKMATLLLMALLAMVADVAQLAMAMDYTVGAPSGSWNLNTNLTQWVESNTFHPGDVLTFSYDPSQHDVLEVSQSDFSSCSTSSPIATHTDGNTVVTLSAVGTRYFICGFNGHCAAGQKVQINVVSGSSTSPGPSSSTPGSTTPSPSGSPPPPDSSATSVAAGAAGLLVGLAALLAF